MPAPPVRILLLEDQDEDAMLVERELVRAGIAGTFRRAVDRPGFIAELRDFAPELILSDHNLIGFTGTDALVIASEFAPSVPFVFVSGTIGEEAAIEAMRRGATDYVIKDRMNRLVPVVQRALREAAGRQDRERLEREFLHAQKMESLGRMASSIAHDFNNLLTIVLGSGALLTDAAGDPATVRRHAADILKAGERGKGLTDQLLAFSRNRPAEIREFDLNERLRTFGSMVRTLVGGGIEVLTAYHRTPLVINGDPARIDQVIMNLLVNARDAMPDGGTVTVTTARLDSADGPPAGFTLVPPGAYALLSVADTGIGMSAEVRARVFEPFFTTKGEGSGTGLGLATVYGIVRQFAGAIQVESARGRGADFRLIFPLAGDPMTAVPLAGVRVLLVDDEDLVRSYARQVLESAGCVVVEAGDGREALAIFERDPSSFRMAVIDDQLPGLDGSELARRVRARSAGTAILVISGHHDESRRAAMERAGTAFVMKPFGPGELTRAAQAALTEAG